MQKKFLSNLFFIILLNVLIKPFYIFGIDVQVQNIVGSESYGMYFALLNFSFLFNMFLDIGVTNYNTKNTAQHPNSLQKYIGSFLGLKLMLSILYIFVTIGFALIVGYSDKEMYLIGFFVFNQILAGLILYLRSNFAGLHLFKIDALLSILDRLLLIIIASALIYGNFTTQAFKIEWFIYAQTFAYASTLLVGLVLTRLKIGKLRLKTNKVFSIAILKKSTPFAVLILLMMLYTRMDSVMIERMLPNGKEQAGIYAQGFRLLDAVNMFAFLVAGILLPVFSRLISEKVSVKPILHVASKLLTGIAIIVGVGLAINSELTISIIYKNNVEASSKVFFWLILSFIPLSISHVFGTLLTANNSLRLLNKMAIVGIALNIGLNLLLIPIMEAEGAAIATVITQSVTALVQLGLAMRVFKFTIHWPTITRLILLITVFLFATILLNQYYGEVWSLLFTILFGIALLFFLKLINIKDLLALLKSKAEA
ncbi:MAG TPA: oligosaccharide flippase family protein [Brumimicrobium sp.]|nr:oligosaccharide flippase family protein [Brumimicrobium sp.]